MARKRPAPLSSSGNPILDISVAREAGTLDDDAEKAGKKCVLLVPFCGLPALALGVGQPAASALTTTITDRIHTTKRRDWIQDTYSSVLFGFFRSKGKVQLQTVAVVVVSFDA